MTPMTQLPSTTHVARWHVPFATRSGRATILAALLLFAGGAFAQVAPHANPVSPLGTNLNTFRDYSSEWATVDAFKQSRAWIPQCMDCRPPVWDTGESARLDLDENGWLRSLPAVGDGARYTSVGTTTLGGLAGHYPGGRWTVLYEGRGTLTYGNDAVRIAAESTPGRDVLQVTPGNGGIWLRITATDPEGSGDYIRNIRILAPGMEDSDEIFHPLFLERTSAYRLLRFVQWMDINGSSLTTWDERPRFSDARWSSPSRGVPAEAAIALANRLHADAWLHVPHQADDEFVQRFAELVRDTLDPALKVWIEYSNEVWNGSFGYTQSSYAQQKGRERWPAAAAGDFQKQMNWYGMRTAEVCDIWKTAFGSDRGRVVCVMAGQAANPWVATQALDCPLWAEGAPCHAHGIDVIAVAPYLDMFLNDETNRAAVQAWAEEADGGLASAFEEIEHGGMLPRGYAGGSLAETARRTASHHAVAVARGLDLVAYEGGQELHDPRRDPLIDALMQAINRDERMGPVYDRYLADWRANGGNLMAHFANVQRYNTFGNAGALEFLDQEHSPKFDSLMRFVDGNPCWWPACAVPPPTACPATVCEGGVCPDRPCESVERCDSGIRLQSARLSITANPFRLRLRGQAHIPKPWVSVAPARTGLRVLVDGVLDVDLAGGDHWRSDRRGRRWTYRDPRGSRGGITRIVVSDVSRDESGMLRIRLFASGPTRTLPTAGTITASIVFDDERECAAVAWNDSDGRCATSEAAIACH